MNLALYIYLCDVVGNVGGVCIFLSVISGIGLLMATIFMLMSEGHSYHKEANALSKKFIKIFIPAAFAFGIPATIIPSQKTMYAMAAAYYGEQAVKSETFQRLNGKAMQLLEVKIDELIGDKKGSK